MIQEDLLQMESSQRQHHEILEHQARINTAVILEEYALFSLLKPNIIIDGNQYCVLYGEDLQSGVCGFGETIYKAILDFNKSFNKEIN